MVAAICYRMRKSGEIEFLLVRTRAGRWTFPKGGVDGDPSGAVAASREAHEEAGVVGHVEAAPFTAYLHAKKARGTHRVHAHLCEVHRLERPSEAYRMPTWFSSDKAKRRLCEDRLPPYGRELARVVDHAVHRVTRRHRHLLRSA